MFKSFYKKFVYLFCLSALCTSAFAEEDFCKQIQGQWKGNWLAPYARCFWKARAAISTNKNEVEFVMTLYDSAFPHKCDDVKQVLKGTCKNNEIRIVLTNDVITGSVTKDTIQLRPLDQDVWLHKVN